MRQRLPGTRFRECDSRQHAELLITPLPGPDCGSNDNDD